MLRKIEKLEKKQEIINKVNTCLNFCYSNLKLSTEDLEKKLKIINAIINLEIDISKIDIWLYKNKNMCFQKIYIENSATKEDLAIYTLPNIF